MEISKPVSIYLSMNTATPSREDFEQAVRVCAIVSNKNVSGRKKSSLS